MKDPSDELISALYTALNGNVTYDSTTIGVYTHPVEWSDRLADQQIRIGEVSLNEVGPKDEYISEGTVEILIDTFFTGKGEGSKKPMNSISNQVAQLIDTSFTLTSFTQVQGRVESMTDLDYVLDPQGSVLQKSIIYNFIISED